MRNIHESPDGSRRQLEMSSDVVAVRYLYLPIAIGVFCIAGLLGILGVVLVYIGAKGDTTMKLFGASLTTADVGVASLFTAAVTVILTIRYLLRTSGEIVKGATVHRGSSQHRILRARPTNPAPEE